MLSGGTIIGSNIVIGNDSEHVDWSEDDTCNDIEFVGLSIGVLCCKCECVWWSSVIVSNCWIGGNGELVIMVDV